MSHLQIVWNCTEGRDESSKYSREVCMSQRVVSSTECMGVYRSYRCAYLYSSIHVVYRSLIQLVRTDESTKQKERIR